MKNYFKRTAAVVTALTAVFSQNALLVSADEESDDAFSNVASLLLEDRQSWIDTYSVHVPDDDGEDEDDEDDDDEDEDEGSYVYHYSPYHETMYEPDTSSLPSKFDQRDVGGVNRVPEIRFQNPFGLCWVFAANAAVEISYAFTRGIDFNKATAEEIASCDFSEKAMAYFTVSPLEGHGSSMSQEGEGFAWTDYIDAVESGTTDSVVLNDAFYTGGVLEQVISYLTSLSSRVLESDAPYINNEKQYDLKISLIDFVDDPGSSRGYKQAENTEKIFYENNTATYDDYLEQLEKVKTECVGCINGRNYKGPGKYYYVEVEKSPAGDWSVDKNVKREGLEFNNIHLLPTPSAFDEKGNYYLDTHALDIIKSELVAGHGVSVNLYGAQNNPGDPIDTSFTAFIDENGKPTTDLYAPIWATYCYYPSPKKNTEETDVPENDENEDEAEEIYANHAVSIVGYDDDFPKEYFNDPEGRIGGNGAFIVRNSWGSSGNSDFTADSPWGNGGDGYYYLSYYDETMYHVLSVDMRPGEDYSDGIVGKTVNKYDYAGLVTFKGFYIGGGKVLKQANVFTADSNQAVYNVGVSLPFPNIRAEADVYLLNDDTEDPTDGELAGSVVIDVPTAGYHEVDLEKPIPVRAGQRYSVVVNFYDYDHDCSFFIYNSFVNNEGRKTYEKMYADANPGQTCKFGYYICGKVNKGESYVIIDDDYVDWKDVIDYVDDATFDIDHSALDYDNFPIQTYSYKELISLDNSIERSKDGYRAGDVIKGDIAVTNNTEYTMNNVAVDTTLVKLGNKGAIESIAPGETVMLPYEYTVTLQDVIDGTVSSTASVTVDGRPVKLFEGLSVTEAVTDIVPTLWQSLGSSDHSIATATFGGVSGSAAPASADPGSATPSESTSETPAAAADTPADTSETPAAAADTPADTSDTPAAAADTPADTSDTPAAAADTPADSSDTPSASTQTETSDDTPAPATGSSPCSMLLLGLSAAAIVILSKKR